MLVRYLETFYSVKSLVFQIHGANISNSPFPDTDIYCPRTSYWYQCSPFSRLIYTVKEKVIYTMYDALVMGWRKLGGWFPCPLCWGSRSLTRWQWTGERKVACSTSMQAMACNEQRWPQPDLAEAECGRLLLPCPAGCSATSSWSLVLALPHPPICIDIPTPNSRPYHHSVFLPTDKNMFPCVCDRPEFSNKTQKGDFKTLCPSMCGSSNGS